MYISVHQVFLRKILDNKVTSWMYMLHMEELDLLLIHQEKLLVSLVE